MKNQFLKTISKLLLLAVFFTSCNSDAPSDSNTEPIDDFPVKLLMSSRSEEFHDLYEYDSDTLVYNNGRLEKALFFSCSGLMYQFEYGDNNKIKTYYYGGGYNYEDLQTNLSQLAYINKAELIYDTNDRLVKKEVYISSELVHTLNFSYDALNRLYLTTYSDDYEVSESEIVEFDDKGNMTQDEAGYKFVYDQNPNPFYILFKEFGAYLIESCTSLEVKYGYHLSPNNLLKVYNSDGDLIYSNDLEYDEDGYPLYSRYNDKNNNSSGSEMFNYLVK